MKEYVTAVWGWDEKRQRLNFRDPAGVAAVRDAGGVAIQEQPGETFIRNIYILPSCQKRGIGTAVITRILTDAAQRGSVCTLNVLASNPSARRLYERLGFRMIQETKERCFMRNELNARRPNKGGQIGVE